MTDEQRQRQMDFILDQQAQFSADIQQLVEQQAQFSADIQQLKESQAQTQNIVFRLANVVAANTEAIAANTEAIKGTQAQVAALVDAQAHTDERLNVLITAVEMLIGGKRES